MRNVVEGLKKSQNESKLIYQIQDQKQIYMDFKKKYFREGNFLKVLKLRHFFSKLILKVPKMS